ncbi:cytochrome c oxidase subunit IV family [Blastocladiella britannica]|nr:cytochrome c oxidase subunit IV family [Blastocladiella britannica]
MFRAAVSARAPLARRAASTLTADAAHAAAASPAAASRTALADIPARWTQLAQQDRTAVVESLLAAQKNDWKTMSLEQKKALFYIAYGPHGPRERLPKGFQTRVFAGVVGVIAASGAMFYWLKTVGGAGVPTTTQEWQEAANEYAKAQNGNPFSGVASPDYKGKGHIDQ